MSDVDRRVESSPAPTPTLSHHGSLQRGALGVGAGLSLAAAGLALITPAAMAMPFAGSLSLWSLTAVAAGTEWVVRTGRERGRHGLAPLADLPLMLGVCQCTVGGLLAARLLGLFLAIAVTSRRPWTAAALGRIARQSGVLALSTEAAVFLTQLVMDNGHPQSGAQWLLLAAVVLSSSALCRIVANLLGLALDGRLASLHGPVKSKALVHLELAVGIGIAGAVFGDLMTAHAGAALAVPVAFLVGLALLVGGRLLDRARALSRVHAFTATLTAAASLDDVMASLLERSAAVLAGSSAALDLMVGGAGDIQRMSRDASGSLVRGPGSLATIHELTGGGARVLTRSRLPRDARPVGAEPTDLSRQALIVPIVGPDGVFGALRVGHPAGHFRAGDLLAAQTIADTAAIFLRMGQLADRLQFDSDHDLLTGLPNRVALRTLLDKLATEHSALSEGQRESALPWAVLLVDLDGFKEVNDNLGRTRGDELLIEIGYRLVAAMPPGATVARLGADEFCVALPGLESAAADDDAGGGALDAALAYAKRITIALEQPVVLEGRRLEIGASIGVVVAPNQGYDGALLLRRADLAMQAAKVRTGGVRVYDSAMEATGPVRLTLISDLRLALDRQHLGVWLQPQLDLATGEIVGAEALVRWYRSGVGYVEPDQFVPVAERSGLIQPLTSVVLENAIGFAARRQREPGPPFTISVNISVRSLLQSDLVAEVRELLATHGLPAELLTLEITESSVMIDAERTLATLTELHALGVRLSLDDFGTGHASLAYIRTLPVHEIKIDKSFVLPMLERPADYAIVRSIVELAASLGLGAVAEGAELDAHVHELRRLGCPRAQGFGIGRPMSIVTFEAWMSDRRARAAAE